MNNTVTYVIILIWVFNAVIIGWSLKPLFELSLNRRRYGKAIKLIDKIANLTEIGALTPEERLQLLHMLADPTRPACRAVESEIRKAIA